MIIISDTTPLRYLVELRGNNNFRIPDYSLAVSFIETDDKPGLPRANGKQISLCGKCNV